MNGVKAKVALALKTELGFHPRARPRRRRKMQKAGPIVVSRRVFTGKQGIRKRGKGAFRRRVPPLRKYRIIQAQLVNVEYGMV